MRNVAIEGEAKCGERVLGWGVGPDCEGATFVQDARREREIEITRWPTEGTNINKLVVMLLAVVLLVLRGEPNRNRQRGEQRGCSKQCQESGFHGTSPLHFLGQLIPSA